MSSKCFLPQGISREERTEFLNSRMRTVKPSICTDRAKIVTQSYENSIGESAVIRRAKALKQTLEEMHIFIDEEELIVGNHGSRPRSAPIYPEFGSLSKKELDMMPTRQVDTLQITDEDKAFLLEQIYPKWVNHNTGDIAKHYINSDDMKVLSSPNRVFDPLSRTRSGFGHYIPNIQYVLNNGFERIEKDALRYLADLDEETYDYLEKKNFYQAILIVIDGIKAYGKRFSDLAKKMAISESNERRKEELLLISENCINVPYKPSKSFYEALQSYWFTIMIDYISQNGSAISAGRFDQYMEPYYQSDINSGKIVREEAREMLEALWVKHSDVIKAGTFNSARNNGGFATTINMVLGGIDKFGKDAVTDFSYLCLDAESSVFNSEPNVSIRVHPRTPNEFLMRVLEILVKKEGGKLPMFSDTGIIAGLLADGASVEDARDYAIVGCVEPTPSGNTMGMTNSSYFNMAKCLELALNDGVCMLTGEQLGPKTGEALTFTSIEDVKKAYSKQIDYFVDMMVRTLNAIERLHIDYTPHIYCSMLLDGCLETGKDCTAGGAKYNYIGVNGVGVADVGDSLCAIDELVFSSKRISMEDLVIGMKNNFSDKPELQHILINGAPKYGNDIDEVDNYVSWAALQYCNSVSRNRDIRGGAYRPGLFCLSSNTPLGRQVAALPSGRASGTPLADGGISPKHGMDILGPTAAAKSIAKLDHIKAVNGVNFNLKFLPTVLKKQEDRQKLLDLIRTYFTLDSFHIQFNVLAAGKLLEAKKNPEKFRGLVVRVAGYSAFFVELDGEIQDEIIARTTQAV